MLHHHQILSKSVLYSHSLYPVALQLIAFPVVQHRSAIAESLLFSFSPITNSSQKSTPQLYPTQHQVYPSIYYPSKSKSSIPSIIIKRSVLRHQPSIKFKHPKSYRNLPSISIKHRIHPILPSTTLWNQNQASRLSSSIIPSIVINHLSNSSIQIHIATYHPS